jgi:hypothetical protein
MMGLWKAWEDHFFRPVATVRARLLTRAVLALLSLDAWLFRVPAGGRYGGDGGLAIAHFAWLDAIQPAPTPGLYVGLMLTVGLLAMAMAVAPRRPLLLLLAALWTWGWAMSVVDAFQHHYFLSLVLVAIAFFPHAQKARTKPPAGERAVIWALPLLGANIAIVYAFAAVTKLDAPWRAGWTLQHIRGVPARLLPLLTGLRDLGVPETVFWPALARGAIVLEVVLVLGYALLPPRLDGEPGRAARVLRIATLAAAILLHGGAELLGLRIGLFSYYMLILAAVFFLPERALLAVEAALAAPLRAIGRLRVRGVRLAQSRGATLAAAIAGAGLCGLLGFSMGLPGAPVAGVIGVVGLGLVASRFAAQGDAWAGRAARGGALAVALLALVSAGSGVRARYWTEVARDLRLRGNLQAAQAAEERAAADRSSPASAGEGDENNP